MTNDVFTGDQQGEQTASALEELVGEGKKFADNEALAKGTKESDGFIETLKQEKQEVADELARLRAANPNPDGATVSDLLDEIKALNKPTQDDGDQPMSEEDFQEKVRAILQGDRADATRTSNRELGNKLVLDKVKGDNAAAKTYVAGRAAELGTTPEQLGALSESSPLAFAKLMELEPSASPKGSSLLPDQVNTQVLKPDAVTEVGGHHTKSYYDERKQAVGHVKWLNDTALQTAMAKDMAALGDKFNQ